MMKKKKGGRTMDKGQKREKKMKKVRSLVDMTQGRVQQILEY